MNILYLCIGENESMHLQAALSIHSFLGQTTNEDTLHVITNHEKLMQYASSRINVIKISEANLKNWKGKHDFFWRVKIKAIEKICLLHPGEPVLYLDTDTFLKGNLSLLKKSLADGHALMHENEGPLSKKKSKTEKKMWRQLIENNIDALAMNPNDCMWNAGVVGIPNTKKGKDCHLALNLCDEMCEKDVTPRLIEQYALSLALANQYGLLEAKNEIIHYWSVKDKWVEMIRHFFIKAWLEKLDTVSIIDRLSDFDTSALPTSKHRKTFWKDIVKGNKKSKR